MILDMIGSIGMGIGGAMYMWKLGNRWKEEEVTLGMHGKNQNLIDLSTFMTYYIVWDSLKTFLFFL